MAFKPLMAGGIKKGYYPGVKAGELRCRGSIPMLEAWRCGTG
jgi:hypothetical protein